MNTVVIIYNLKLLINMKNLTKKELLEISGGDNIFTDVGNSINGFFRGLFGFPPACDC